MSYVEPDCANCIQYKTCERAKEGTFCPEFQSEVPVYNAAEDPNVLWAQGEDVELQMDKLILDPTCACRSIWFQKNEPHTLYVDQREMDIKKRFGSKDYTHHLKIQPDIFCSFTDLPFPDAFFWHVVFDPPHLYNVSDVAWLNLKYGRLPRDWKSVIQQGFNECMRVLKPNGTLIFKWSDIQITTHELIKAIGVKPLYGHRSGKAMKTHWLAFMKFNDEMGLGI